MTTLGYVKAGDEIFNTHGELPRADLLRRYGYISESYKIWDVVEIYSNKILEVVRAHTELSEPRIAERVSANSS